MPKETFLNLSEDKKQKIIAVALEEFAMFDYKTASISRIVKKAGIAKGSIYQYFENKKELYLYLLHLASERKLNFITQSINSDATGFFEKYKQIIFLGAKFDLNYPMYSRVLLNATQELHNKELGDTPIQLMKAADNYMESFVMEAQDKNEIRSDLQADLIAFIISRLSVDISEYICSKYNFSYATILREGNGELPITDKELENILDDLITFFKNGLHS